MDGAPTLADDDLAAARAGDDAAFARLVAPLRRELHAHCYRMPQQRALADLDDAHLGAVVDGYARALEHRDARTLV